MWNLFQKGPLFISACEPSGDLYASLFIKRLKSELNKRELEIFCVGGEQLGALAKLVYDYNRLKTLGFAAGFISMIRNYQSFRKIARMIYKIKPTVFMPVAYPGINLLLCRYAKRVGARVIYLLPPQIWAWGEFRKYFIKRWVDLIISVFPFEYHFYNCKGYRVIYWQNPLFEELKRYKRTDYKKRIGFMPGSRVSEIKRNLPVIIEIIKEIAAAPEGKSPVEYSIILHPDTLNYLPGELKKINPSLFPGHPDRYQVMRNCDLIITCSGTASLECAIMDIPQVFFNRPSFFDYHLFPYLLKIREFNLTNLYFGRKVVPSLVLRNKGFLVFKISGLIKNFLNESDR